MYAHVAGSSSELTRGLAGAQQHDMCWGTFDPNIITWTRVCAAWVNANVDTCEYARCER